MTRKRRALASLGAIILWWAPIGVAQVPNDTCSNAIFVSEGVPTPGTNIGATVGPDLVGVCGGMGADVWYVFYPNCSGAQTATTCDPSSNFDTVLAAWDGTNGCGSLVPLVCNDDSCGLRSSITFQATVGTFYYISVGGYNGATGTFTLNVGPGGGSGIALNFFNLGPGTLGYTISNGSVFGAFLTILTLNQGNYPNGWLFGIDVLPVELQVCLSFGYPFSGNLDQCGGTMVGPVGGLPSGLTAYAFVAGFPPGGSVPTTISPATFGTVP
jgi:hypothetical protein